KQEALDRLQFTFDINKHATFIVKNVAVKGMAPRESEHKRPKPHALDDSTDLNLCSFDHGSLECGGSAPLFPSRTQLAIKAVPSHRTPKHLEYGMLVRNLALSQIVSPRLQELRDTFSFVLYRLNFTLFHSVEESGV